MKQCTSSEQKKNYMLTMTEKTLLFLAITFSIVLAGIAILPTSSYEVSLVTTPNSETFHVPAGEPFNITCKGSGDDAEKFSSLEWFNKEGQLIAEGIPGTVELEKNSLSLTFTKPKEDESGVYKCVAVYEKKKTLEKSVSILFYGNKPVFDTSFQNVTATENSYLEILCDAEGESPISYDWYNQSEDKITTSSNSSIYANSSVLIIPTVTLNHTGRYACIAKNSHGLSSKAFQLTVLPAFDNETNATASVQEVLVVNITATSVKFAVNVTGPVKYIEVLYKESRSSAEYFKEFKYVLGDDYEIKDLIPAGNYTFKFRANAAENNTWPNKRYQVVLLPDKPEVIFRTIDSGTVKIEWMRKFETIMRNTIDRYEISYFTVQMEGGKKWKPNSCAITVHIPACASGSYTIAGLSQGVYYEIQLRAHTVSGYSEPYVQKLRF